MSRLPENPEFMWSPSRDELFTACPLAYFYCYYQSWDGWNWNSEKPKRDAYLCKNITSRPYVCNNAFREGMTRIFRGFRSDAYARHPAETRPSAVTNLVRERLNKAYISRRKLAGWFADPKRNQPLMEAVYKDWMNDDFLAVSVGGTKEKLEEVSGYVGTKTYQEFSKEALLHLDAFRKEQEEKVEPLIKEVRPAKPSDWILEISEDPFRSGLDSFMLDDVLVRVGIDLVYQKMDGTIVAVNWRTSDSRKDADALASKVIALYIKERYGVFFNKTCVRNEYVVSHEVEEYVPTKRDLRETRKLIEAEVSKMKGLVVDGDTVANVPLPMDSFDEKVDNPNCFWCRYRGICKRHEGKNASFLKTMEEEVYPKPPCDSEKAC